MSLENKVYVVIHCDESNNFHEIKGVKKTKESADELAKDEVEKLVMTDLMKTSNATKEDYDNLKDCVCEHSDGNFWQYEYGDSDTITVYEEDID